jgi:hypothetical protein
LREAPGAREAPTALTPDQSEAIADARAKVERFCVKLGGREVVDSLASLERAGCDRAELGLRILRAARAYEIAKSGVPLGISDSRFRGLPDRAGNVADEIEKVNLSPASPVSLLIEKMREETDREVLDRLVEQADTFSDLPAAIRKWADFVSARAQEGVVQKRRYRSTPSWIPEARSGPAGPAVYGVSVDQEILLLAYVRRKTGGPHFREVGILLHAAYGLEQDDAEDHRFNENALKERERRYRKERKTPIPLAYHLLGL